MPYTKITLIFRQSAFNVESSEPTRESGWSESVYRTAMTESDAKAYAQQLANRRAGCLGKTSAIVGFRTQNVEPFSRAIVGPLSNSGTANTDVDIAQMAGYVYLPTADNPKGTRRLTLRGIPDAWVANGVIRTAVVDIKNRLQAYVQFLHGSLFPSYSATTQYGVFNIDANGTYHLSINCPFANADIVDVLRTTDLTGRRRSFRARINGVPADARTGILANWPWGATNGGSIRLHSLSWPVLNTALWNADLIKTSTRKAGRPFFLSHGAVRRH